MALASACFLRAAQLGAALGTLAASAAFAEDAAPLGSAKLRYLRERGAERCPDEATLAQDVISRLGYDPFQREAPRLLEVSVVGEGGQLRATIKLSQPGSAIDNVHRLVSGALDCSVLHPALALAIALAIDPARALALDASPSLPAPTPPDPFPKPPVAEAPSLAPRTPAEVPAPRARPRGLLYGGGYAAVAAGPTTTGGVELGGGVQYPRFSIAVEVRGDMPTRLGDGRTAVGRAVAQAVPCVRAFAFGVCALAAIGVSIARAEGYPVSREVLAPYVALGARLMAEVTLRKRLALGLHADVFGLLTRLVLRVDGDVAYRDAPASGSFGIDLIGRFGDGS